MAALHRFHRAARVMHIRSYCSLAIYPILRSTCGNDSIRPTTSPGEGWRRDTLFPKYVGCCQVVNNSHACQVTRKRRKQKYKSTEVVYKCYLSHASEWPIERRWASIVEKLTSINWNAHRTKCLPSGHAHPISANRQRAIRTDIWDDLNREMTGGTRLRC